jgi:hypothetical protein
MDATLPTTLTNGSTAVIIHQSPTHQWKNTAHRVHKSFQNMGIDAIIYLNELDFTANPVINKKFTQFLAQRRIAQLILIYRAPQQNDIWVLPLPENDQWIKPGMQAWHTSAVDLGNVVLKMARQLKELSPPQRNFLINSVPEFFEEMSLFSGTRFFNYPTQLMRTRLAVRKFMPINLDSTRTYSDRVLEIIETYNREISVKNDTLEKIMSEYPYDFEFVGEESVEDLYRQRFQFILSHLHTTGANIRELLMYEDEQLQENLITQVPLPDGTRRMKMIPSGTPVHKYYMFQTIAKNIHVGRYWDAAPEWDQSLRNFLGHMLQDFEKRTDR